MRCAWIALLLFACGKGDGGGKPPTKDITETKPAVDPCAASENCKLTGACTKEINSRTNVEEFGTKGVDVNRSVSVTCVPGADEHCRQSQLCKERGECALAKNPARCVAGSDADCRASDQCKTTGRCAKDPSGTNAYCIVAKDEDCAAAKACTETGECVAGKAGTLVACVAKSAADCAAAPGCKKNGTCSLLSGRCVPAKTQDCEQSDACKTEGRCRTNVSECIK